MVALAGYNDCIALVGPSNDGHWNNGVTAISLTTQPPFCWGKNSATFPAIGAAQLYGYTFIPTTLAVTLTSTSFSMLLATAAGFNAVSTWSLTGSGVLTGASSTTAATPAAPTTTGITYGANTPAFKVAVAYPTTTVTGASALTMSLAAATVLATLF